MIKKNFNSDKVQSGSNEDSPTNVLDLYQDHIDSFFDALLVQETLRRKELKLPFSQTDAEEFLNKIRTSLTKDINQTNPSLDKQKLNGFNNLLIDKAKNEGKLSTINLMKKTSIEDAISEWLLSLSSNTLKGYERGIRSLISEDYIRLAEKQGTPDDHTRTLFDFSNVPHDLVLEKIFSHPTWSTSIKTRNATSYKNFIKFLEAKTEGIITFLRIKPMFPKNKEHSPVKNLSADQIKQILSLLKEENPRDYFLVYLYISSDLKLCDTLQLRKKDIDLKKNQEISSLIPDFKDLRDDDYIFRTRNGKLIDPMQISRTLQRIFQKIGITSMPLKDIKKITRFNKNSFEIKDLH